MTNKGGYSFVVKEDGVKTTSSEDMMMLYYMREPNHFMPHIKLHPVFVKDVLVDYKKENKPKIFYVTHDTITKMSYSRQLERRLHEAGDFKRMTEFCQELVEEFGVTEEES